MREVKKIEKFFLLTVLRISIAGVMLILVTDVIFYPEDVLSIIIDSVILSACVLSYLIRQKHFNISVVLFTSVTLLAMFFQCLVVPINMSTAFSVILLVGFLFSMLLQGKLLWIMHGIALSGIVALFIYQSVMPSLRFASDTGDVISVAITYLVLYGNISYFTAVLKFRYDHLHQYMRKVNIDLQDKTNEIEAQNGELIQIQNNLSEINLNLERMVNDRTEKIREQNEILLKYNYANAHHLRGPVARLLGLVTIYRLEPFPDTEFYLKKLEEQAHEIDSVIKQINLDLQTNDISTPSHAN